jgi:hypothetical protein
MHSSTLCRDRLLNCQKKKEEKNEKPNQTLYIKREIEQQEPHKETSTNNTGIRIRFPYMVL